MLCELFGDAILYAL